MKLSRRDALTLGLGATAAAFLPGRAAEAGEEAIAAFTGGLVPARAGQAPAAPALRLALEPAGPGRLRLRAEAPGAGEIALFALDGPQPLLARARFGPFSGGAGRLEVVLRAPERPTAAGARFAAVARIGEGFVRRDLSMPEVAA